MHSIDAGGFFTAICSGEVRATKPTTSPSSIAELHRKQFDGALTGFYWDGSGFGVAVCSGGSHCVFLSDKDVFHWQFRCSLPKEDNCGLFAGGNKDCFFVVTLKADGKPSKQVLRSCKPDGELTALRELPPESHAWFGNAKVGVIFTGKVIELTQDGGVHWKPLTNPLYHKNEVRFVQFSASCNDLYLVGVSDDVARVRLKADGSTEVVWTQELLESTSLMSSPTSSIILDESSKKVWVFSDPIVALEMESGTVSKRIETAISGEMAGLAVSGDQLIAWGHEGVDIWDVSTEKVRKLKHLTTEPLIAGYRLNKDEAAFVTRDGGILRYDATKATLSKGILTLRGLPKVAPIPKNGKLPTQDEKAEFERLWAAASDRAKDAAHAWDDARSFGSEQERTVWMIELLNKWQTKEEQESEPAETMPTR